MSRRAALAALVGVLWCAGAAAPASASLTLVPAYTDSAVAPVKLPIFVTAPPDPGDSRLFVVERGGRIRVVVNGVVQDTPFLDIRSSVYPRDSESGMLSMAFAPNYSSTGLFYVYYVEKPSTPDGHGDIRIDEFHATPASNVADAGPGRHVMQIGHPQNPNHYGGTLQFGPDGFLYAGTGDGGSGLSANAQDTKTLLGKMLRINPTPLNPADGYDVPGDNLYASNPRCTGGSGAAKCPEIAAIGLRNPFRWSFDSQTGDALIGDVGENTAEEIDYVPAGRLVGANFGWNCLEGDSPFTPGPCPMSLTYVPPILTYPHSGATAVTGGVVVRDASLTPLAGRYLYADYYGGVIRSLQPGPKANADPQSTTLPVTRHIAAFGEDSSRHVYLAQLEEQKVWRLACTDDGNGCNAAPTPPPGTGGAGQPPAPGAPAGHSHGTGAGRDTRGPSVTLRAARVQRALRSGSIVVSIACDEACELRVAARLELRAGGARIYRLHGVDTKLASHQRIKVRIRLTPHLEAVLRRVLARRGRAVVRVTVRGVDAAGNAGQAGVTVGLRR